MFTMILLTVLYTVAWYHDLNLVVLQLQEDTLVCTSNIPLGNNLNHDA